MTETNSRKAYHAATAASDILWGGEHGWESEKVGEHDLANELRRKVAALQVQARPVGDLVKRRTLVMSNGTPYPTRATIDLYVNDWDADRFEVYTVIAGSVPVRFAGSLAECIEYGQHWWDARTNEGWMDL